MWSNPWFVGIVGGTISGIIVFFITTFLYNKISKKEYYKKVNQVNLETISLLIMSVSEDKIPSLRIIKSLLNSISRKYDVKINDVNSIEATIEDLIKVIFETNFIPIDRKNELSVKLTYMIENQDQKEENVQKDKISNLDSRYLRLGLSLSLSTITMVTFALSLRFESLNSWGDLIFTNVENTKMVLLISVTTLSIVVLGMTYFRAKMDSKEHAQVQEYIKRRIRSLNK